MRDSFILNKDTGRWDNYFCVKNEAYESFWKKYFELHRNVLFIMGDDDDDLDMYTCIKSMINNMGTGDIDCIVISQNDKIIYNEKEINNDGKKFVNCINSKIIKDISNSQKAANIFKKIDQLENYSDVIIDITSLPFEIYLPLIGKIMYLIDYKNNKKIMPNVHIVVAYNPTVNELLMGSDSSEDAQYLHGFNNKLNTVADQHRMSIWIPILGEYKYDNIASIMNLIDSVEICPVLPFPSKNPRRGDNLMLEYHDLLIDAYGMSYQDIIYSDEYNPFETYREINKIIHQYRRSLKPIAECKFIISSLSNKIISLATLFVAYEQGIMRNQSVGIAYVESKKSTLNDDRKKIYDLSKTELHSFWISGRCYE